MALSLFSEKIHGIVSIVRTSAAAGTGTCTDGAVGFCGASPLPGGLGALGPPPSARGFPPRVPPLPPPDLLNAALNAICIC